MSGQQAESLAAWILANAQGIEYGEVTVRITRHDGKTKQVEKTVSTKERPGVHDA